MKASWGSHFRSSMEELQLARIYTRHRTDAVGLGVFFSGGFSEEVCHEENKNYGWQLFFSMFREMDGCDSFKFVLMWVSHFPKDALMSSSPQIYTNLYFGNFAALQIPNFDKSKIIVSNSKCKPQMQYRTFFTWTTTKACVWPAGIKVHPDMLQIATLR